jgi:hypothetical protein
MAAVIGALRAELSASIAEFADDLGKAAREVQKFAGRFEKVGDSMQRVGATMSLAITAPLVLFGKQAVSASVDAEELQSAFNYSFGAMAGQMNDWARTTGDAMGRSTQSLQQQAFSFNQLFKAAAPTPELAADMSKQFTLLANDLSSFFNVTEDDALEKLRAGLVGEAEPLRAFGVFLSEAAVKAKALELGLGDANGELSEQEKIMARAAIIMEQTKDAQGDLARTSNSAANEQRALTAVMQEQSVRIGQILLPVWRDMVGWLKSGVDAFSQLSPETQKFVVVAAAVAAAIGPIVAGIGFMLTGFAGFLKIVPAIVAAGRAVGLAVAMMGGPVTVVIAAIAALAAAWIMYGDQIKEAAEKAYRAVDEWLGGGLTATVQAVKAIGQQMWQDLKLVIQGIGQLFSGDFAGAMDSFLAIFASRWEAAKGLMDAFLPTFLEAIRAWGAQLVTLLAGVVAAIDQSMGGGLTVAIEAVKVLFTGFLEHIRLVAQMLVQLFNGDLSGAVTSFVQVWQNGWNTAKTFLDTLLPQFLETLKAWGAEVVRIVGETITAVGTWLVDRLGEIVTAVGEKLAMVTGFFADMYDAVVGHSWVPDMVTKIGDEMAKLGDTMVKPAQAAASSTERAFSTLADSVGGVLDEMQSSGKVSFSSMIRLAEDFGRAMASLFSQGQPGAGGGAGMGGGGGGGGWGGILSSVISLIGSLGFRADGGPVASGRSYVVGEEGPEVFTPTRSGQIIPNGPGGGVMHMTLNLAGANGDRAIADAAYAAAKRAIAEAPHAVLVNEARFA